MVRSRRSAESAERNSRKRGTNKQPVYLSPHLDDAVLSCGGLIHRQRDMHPLVITCFAGVPDYAVLSPFAAGQHQRWGEPADPIGWRRAEDVAALAHLGATYEHWDYLDCIYRRDPASGEFLYASEEALWGAVARAEGALVAEMAARLGQVLGDRETGSAVAGDAVPGHGPRSERGIASRNRPPAMTMELYAPLAVGRHVDHQLVLRAALRLRRRGWSVRFYEDYPYAEDPQKLARALRGWASPPDATVVRLSGDDLAAKTAAIRCYASQLDVLFGGEAAVAQRVSAYALAVSAGDGYGERYWSSRQPSPNRWPDLWQKADSRQQIPVCRT